MSLSVLALAVFAASFFPTATTPAPVPALAAGVRAAVLATATTWRSYLETDHKTELAQPAPEQPHADVRRKGRHKHDLEITVGGARVVYDTTAGAWALPGGALTRDRALALAVATNINQIIKNSSKRGYL